MADKAATGGKVRALENPIKQRWGSSVTAVESTTFNKLHLRRCLDLPAWSEQVERQSHSRAAREEAVALVKSNDVFTSFDVTVNIFSSIVKLIGWIESDNPRFHKVWPRFKEEQANLKATIPSSLKSRVRTNEKEAFAGPHQASPGPPHSPPCAAPLLPSAQCLRACGVSRRLPRLCA